MKIKKERYEHWCVFGFTRFDVPAKVEELRNRKDIQCNGKFSKRARENKKPGEAQNNSDCHEQDDSLKQLGTQSISTSKNAAYQLRRYCLLQLLC